MEAVTSRLEKDLDAEAIRRHPVVAATKNAYRLLGKDPNRYRPAAESLLRRIASGKGLYRVNNVVDVLNRVSVETRSEERRVGKEGRSRGAAGEEKKKRGV